MSFGQAIAVCFAKYVDFTGRARRSEYWWFYLFGVILEIVASIIDAAIDAPVFRIIVGLALLLPILAAGVRRLHDTGRTGFWLFIGLIPLIGTITLIVFYCQDSDFDNKYGPNPKQVGLGAL